MKTVLIAAAAAIGFAGAALAEGPQLLTDDQMDKIVAGGTVALGPGAAVLEGLFPAATFPGFNGTGGPAAAPDTGATCPAILVNGTGNAGCP